MIYIKDVFKFPAEIYRVNIDAPEKTLPPNAHELWLKWHFLHYKNEVKDEVMV